MPAPLPLTDLLELLQERKMEIGVREHLTIGRLLFRWDNTDVEAFRNAIAAVLARNQEEVATVRSAFDELYRAPVGEKPVPPPPTLARFRERRSLRWAFLTLVAAAALCLVLGALLWPRPEPPGPQPIASPGPSPSPPSKVERLPIPTIPDTYLRPDWDRVLLGAAGIASGLLLGLYCVRLRRATERAARRRWHEELEELPEPQGYEIELGEVAPPFPPAVLDEAASLLGRRAPVSPRFGALDIECSLQQTLRAGLAPQVVFRARSAAPSLVVLEDIGSSMAPLRGCVSALLAGLTARGVPLDRWQFHVDGTRVFRSLGEHEISLRQLARMRAASPLLVLSTGDGVLQGWEGRVAPWLEQLLAWPHRAWLHPAGDSGSWHPVLRRPEDQKTSLWPMTPEGLLAAARHLAHGRPGPARATWRTAADRPVTPLDVDRLRWLLSLTPRRDPDLLERLRQKFCSHVPPAALLEAFDAPPLGAPLGLPPEAGTVHAFLADLLASSEPEPGTAAHERWRLDRALQEIRIPGREKRALGELTDLARGPLAGQVGDAIEDLTARTSGSPEPPLSRQVARKLRRAVLVPIRRRASRFHLGGWRRLPPPSWLASAAALLVALLAALALPALSRAFNREEPVRQETRYTLRLIDEKEKGPFRFEVVGDTKWRNVPKMLMEGHNRLGAWPDSIELPASARGSTYYVRDVKPDKEGVLGISNYVWVERRETTPPPPPSTGTESRVSELRVLLVARDNEARPLAGLRFAYQGTVSSPTNQSGATALDLPAGPVPGQQIKIDLAPGYKQSEEWFLVNPQVNIPSGGAAIEVMLMPRRTSGASGRPVRNPMSSDRVLIISPQRAERLREIEASEAQLLDEFSRHDSSQVEDLKDRIDRLRSDLALARTEARSDTTDLDAIELELRSLVKELQERSSAHREAASSGTAPATEEPLMPPPDRTIPDSLAEAEPLMRRALAIDETSYGPDHPNVARDLSNLAQLLLVTNRLSEAEPLMRRALVIDQKSFGMDHPNVARDLSNLAHLLQTTNRLAEAEPLMRRALAIDEKSYGPEHPNVAIDLTNLAVLLQATGRIAEAEALMRRALSIFYASYRRTGRENPNQARALENYRRLLQAMGKSQTEIEESITELFRPPE